MDTHSATYASDSNGSSLDDDAANAPDEGRASDPDADLSAIIVSLDRLAPAIRWSLAEVARRLGELAEEME